MCASKFVAKLAESCETMWVQLDAVLTTDDVEVGSKYLVRTTSFFIHQGYHYERIKLRKTKGRNIKVTNQKKELGRKN